MAAAFFYPFCHNHLAKPQSKSNSTFCLKADSTMLTATTLNVCPQISKGYSALTSSPTFTTKFIFSLWGNYFTSSPLSLLPSFSLLINCAFYRKQNQSVRTDSSSLPLNRPSYFIYTHISLSPYNAWPVSAPIRRPTSPLHSHNLYPTHNPLNNLRSLLQNYSLPLKHDKISPIS